VLGRLRKGDGEAGAAERERDASDGVDDGRDCQRAGAGRIRCREEAYPPVPRGLDG